MYRRILVPLDGSPTAEKVLPIALDEAKIHNATVVLMRVIPPLRGTLMVPLKLQEQLNQQAQSFTEEYLLSVAQKLRDEGLAVETEIQAGQPAECILDFAESSGCDLIIIGSRGETGAMRWRFGGVANKIVRALTSMPVLVVTT